MAPQVTTDRVLVGHPVARQLLLLAGYTPVDANESGTFLLPKGGAHAEEYEQIMHALIYIGNRKVDDYGDFRQQDLRSYARESWGAYWDIQRKHGRLETQISSDASIEQLMETLGDEAVYCVRMIQILLRLREKGLVPNAGERTGAQCEC
jgi:hypothetical protein